MKKSLIIALALMLVLAFASSAMAAQLLNGNSYLSTTETAYTLPGGGSGTTVDRVYANNKFTADGKTNYPYEIYLPNEKNPENYRIHSNYSKNTDACASCHSTHTALNNMLLQWYTAYDTCMACHDGTVTTTYDVARGLVGAGVAGVKVPAAGGMFGATGTEVSLSSHNVSGALDNTAAPGGTTVASADGKSWNVEFSCTACHTPHGEGGNARILKGDVNGQATIEAARRGFNTKLTATDALDAAKGLTATVYGEAAPGTTLNGISGATPIEGLAYYYAKPVTDADRLVYNVGAGYMLTSVKVWVYKGTAGAEKWTDSTSSFKIDNQLGYTRAILLSGKAPALTNVKFVAVPIIKVVMDVKNYLNTNSTIAERVYHNSGINQFCGACHTDYNTASFEVYEKNFAESGDGRLSSAPEFETGPYSQAHRHSVGRKGSLLNGIVQGIEFPNRDYDRADSTGTVLSCLGCHVAHGAGQDYWNIYLVEGGVLGASGDAWTTDETVEIAGSSALKRMPNMGICLNCHNKQTSAIGNAANSAGGVATTIAIDGNTTDLGQAGATYVGAAKCAPCHPANVETYKETAHSQMVTFTTQADKDYWYARLVAEGFVNGTDGNGLYVEQEDTVSSTTYRFYKQDFALNVSWDKKNTVIAVSYLAGSSFGKLCVLYEDGPVEFENYGCVNCHTTPKGLATPDWADFQAKVASGALQMGIQCEDSGCHGPASRHVASPSSKNIYNPGALSIQAQSGSTSCGLCHSSGGHNGEFWKAVAPKGFTAKGPSRMYAAGVLSCITCHTPHSNDVQDISRNGVAKADLQLKMPVRALCNGCHENRLITKADFDKYIPLKANGMPSHLFNGLGGGVPTTKDHRAE